MDADAVELLFPGRNLATASATQACIEWRAKVLLSICSMRDDANIMSRTTFKRATCWLMPRVSASGR